MRDSHRLKEKYELTLDNRQIVSLTVASLVVLGGVFMLGVVVGKKLSAEQGDHPPADLLSALDQKTAALDAATHDDASLTFPDELTRKSPSLIPAPPPRPEPVKPAEGAKVEPRPPTPEPEAKKPEVAALEPVKPVESAAAAVDAEPIADKVPEKVAEKPAEKAAEKVAEKHVDARLPEAPRAEPVATRTHDGGALAQAFARVQKPPAEAAADGAFTLQLSAYQDRAEADRFAGGLRDKGYAPYIIEANVPNKGVWYRVRMGRFPSKEAATRYLEDFKRETSMSAIVTNH